MERNILFISLLMGWLSLSSHPDGHNPINPEPILTIEGLGNGYGSPVITSSRIFVTGEKDGNGTLFAFDLKGNLVWKTSYGHEWNANFRGSRATPAIADSLIYTSSGLGDIACFKTETGEKCWSINMISDFNGVNAVFGYSIPVFLDEDRLYCLPGGEVNNIACLDRFAGKIIWSSPGKGETPGYAALLMIHLQMRKLLVAYSELTLLGLDATNGSILWTYDLSITGEAPCNKPIYSDGFLYIAGSGNGAVKFRVSNDGSQLSKVWSNEEFNPYFGGFVKIENYLYGSTEGAHFWYSLDSETGKPVDSLVFNVGATIQAGNKLVLYNQRGMVGLVNYVHGKMTLGETFAIKKGSMEHFTPPVLHGNLLFIRHGDSLLVYDYQAILNL
jgi:outer membrane protein assembly factor BamB